MLVAAVALVVPTCEDPLELAALIRPVAMGGAGSVDHGQWGRGSVTSPTTSAVHYTAAAHPWLLMQGHDVHPAKKQVDASRTALAKSEACGRISVRNARPMARHGRCRGCDNGRRGRALRKKA